MILGSKPRTAISDKIIFLHLCVSAFRRGWAIRHDSWLRFQEAISKCIHACCNIYSLPAAYFGEKSALLTVAITVSNIFWQVPVLKKKSFFFLFLFLNGFNSYCWPTLKSPANHRAIGFFPLCSLPLYHVPQISLSYSFSSWTSFIIIIFFFFALNECDAISSQCNSLTMYSIRGVGVYLVGMLASAKVAWSV